MTMIYYTVHSLLGSPSDVVEVYKQLMSAGISAQLRDQTVVCTQMTREQVIQVQDESATWALTGELQNMLYRG